MTTTRGILKAKHNRRMPELGKVPDTQIAKLEGLSHGAISSYRQRRGIPKFKRNAITKLQLSEYLEKNLDNVDISFIKKYICRYIDKKTVTQNLILKFAENHNLKISFKKEDYDISILGKYPDREVAKLWNSTLNIVRNRRKKLGIAQCQFSNIRELKIVEYLKNNPNDIIIKDVLNFLGLKRQNNIKREYLQRIADNYQIIISFFTYNNPKALLKIRTCIRRHLLNKGIILKEKFLEKFTHQYTEDYYSDSTHHKTRFLNKINSILSEEMILKRVQIKKRKNPKIKEKITENDSFFITDIPHFL